MHASMFPLDLGRDTSSRDRERSGRALAAALAALHGFVAFIALEAENGVTAGFCICFSTRNDNLRNDTLLRYRDSVRRQPASNSDLERGFGRDVDELLY